jgi:hypothetical protein
MAIDTKQTGSLQAFQDFGVDGVDTFTTLSKERSYENIVHSINEKRPYQSQTKDLAVNGLIFW